MSAAQPPPLLQQELQQIQHMQQPLLPHDPGDDDGGGRAGKTFEATGFFSPRQPPQQPRAIGFQAGPLSSSHTQQLQQQSLRPRQDFLPQQQILYPQPQQQLLQSPLASGAPSAAGSAGGGTGRTTTGSSSSSVPGRPAAAPATGNPPSSSAGCNQIQVEPRHVLQLLRQLVDGNPESFKVRPDMPPRAVHQLLRELEDARLIKQQEVLRRAHALGLQQQQHRDGSFEAVSAASPACATPTLGVAPAALAGPPAAQERRHPEGRHNREQQQQGVQLAGDAGESERKKKKKKKAVFPEGPGGWGPETTNSSNAAAAAAATATAAPAAGALCSKSTTSSSTDVSRLLKVLPTLSHDKQVDLLVELLAAPDGLARIQELKDAGRLSSGLVQQALRKYRQQQKCRTLSSSNGAAGRLNEGGAQQQAGDEAIALLNRAVYAETGTASDGSGIGGSSSYYSAAQLADLGSHMQRRPSFVKSLHQWTRKEDAWAATAAAAAADVVYRPAAAEGVLTAPSEVLAAASQQEGRRVLESPQTRTNGDYAWHAAELAAFAPRCGDMQKAHSSNIWLSGGLSDGGAVKTLRTPPVYSEGINSAVGHILTSYFEADPAGIIFSSSPPIASGAADVDCIGMKREQRSASSAADGGLEFDYSEAPHAEVSRGGDAAARSRLLMRGLQDANINASHRTTAAAREWLWQQRLQKQQQLLVPDVCLRQALEEESEDNSRALLSDMRHCRGRFGASISSSQVMIHPVVTVAAENETNGGGNAVLKTEVLDTLAFVSTPPLRAASRVATSRDRAEHSALLLYNNSINRWVQGREGVGEREKKGGNEEEMGKGIRGASRIDPAALLYFGKGVDPAYDSQAAIQTRKKASSMHLSRLEVHIQRLVELTVRRLGAAYGGRLFLTDEVEIRAMLKQALKDRLRALAPTLCALAEYRAERHVQRLVSAAAETKQQRSTGEEVFLDEAEDTEGSMMGCGSMGRQSDRINHLFYDGSAFHGLMGAALLEGETPQQQICPTRKRSHADTTWQTSMASHSDGADVAAVRDAEVDFFAAGAEGGDEWLQQRREKISRKSLLQRFAVHQCFDELHVLFMQKESDKVLVEHLRKLQEQQRKGRGGGRGKHKHLLATDSSLQSVPFIRNADDGREGYDSAMGGCKPAVPARGAARDAAAAAAVFAYLEKQGLLLNSSSINSDADAQLALLSAQLHLELRQHQLSEVAEEKAIEFAKVAHAQRLLLLKATALDFRTFLHTKTAAAFFPMRFRERLLQYVEAVHFDLQPPPPRIPRTLLPVASPPQSLAETAAAAPALSTAAVVKTTAGLSGKSAAEKKSAITTTGSNSVHLARSGALLSAASRSIGSGKSNTTLVSAFAACGLLRSSSAISDGAKSSGAGLAPKEARRALIMSVPSQTIMEDQVTTIQLTGETRMDSSLSHRDGSAATGAAGGYATIKDGSSTVGTGKKGGILKTSKARVRRKVSATVVGPGRTTAVLQQRGYGEEQAGAKVLGSAETPGAVSGGGAGMRGKSGSREGVAGGGTQNGHHADHRGSSSVSNVEGYKHPTSTTDTLAVHMAPDNAMADNRKVLRRQQGTRISSAPSRAESLAELFGIPTVDANDAANAASQRLDDNAGVKPNSSSNVNNGSRHSDANVRNTSSTGSSRRGAAEAGEVLQTQQLTQQEAASTAYATPGNAQWGFRAGHAAAGDAVTRKQPQQSLHYQQSTDHRQKSGQVEMPRDENILTPGRAWNTEQPGGFSSIVDADNFTHSFGTVSATECSSVGVVIPELEGEGEEDCL